MGIAWIANILFFDVNLLFIAYIMTIFIASQGIIIFILFVPLSKQVWKPNAFISFNGAVCVLMCVGEAGIPQVVEQQSISVLISQ